MTDGCIRKLSRNHRLRVSSNWLSADSVDSENSREALAPRKQIPLDNRNLGPHRDRALNWAARARVPCTGFMSIKRLGFFETMPGRGGISFAPKIGDAYVYHRLLTSTALLNNEVTMNRKLFVILLSTIVFAVYFALINRSFGEEVELVRPEPKHALLSFEPRAREDVLKARRLLREASAVDGIVNKALKVIYSEEEVVVVPDAEADKK